MYCTINTLIIPEGMTSIIGSGGKTTFLRYLSKILPGTVILTTSTHIFPFQGIPFINAPENSRNPEEQLRTALKKNRVVCLGRELPSGKLSSPSGSISYEKLLSLADYVLVEADGSKHFPLKAHRKHEPVIPPCSSLTIGLIGASGIEKPLYEVCHCPELFSELSGMDANEIVRPKHIARVINKEDLADLYFINQTDVLPDPGPVFELCRLLNKKTAAGSLLTGQFL